LSKHRDIIAVNMTCGQLTLDHSPRRQSWRWSSAVWCT